VGRRHRVRTVLSITAALAVVVTGCGEADEVDAGSIEDAIPAALIPEHPELVTEVSCPGPVDRGIGTVTACTARIGGTAVEVTATQVDDDGALRVEMARTLLDVDDLAADLSRRLTADVGDPTSVICDGPVVRVLAVGDELRCVATDTEDRDHTFVVTILDEDANYDLTLE
jgi:hypothetical protein